MILSPKEEGKKESEREKGMGERHGRTTGMRMRMMRTTVWFINGEDEVELVSSYVPKVLTGLLFFHLCYIIIYVQDKKRENFEKISLLLFKLG